MMDGAVEVLAFDAEAEGVAWFTIRHFGEERRALWVRGKAQHTRRVRTCALSGVLIVSGDLVWRPLKSTTYRFLRIRDADLREHLRAREQAA